jgi:hypothetical protein
MIEYLSVDVDQWLHRSLESQHDIMLDFARERATTALISNYFFGLLRKQ